MKPTEELIHLLGLDVPIAPTLALAGLKADGLLIHWKPLDQKSNRRYNLTINGITGKHGPGYVESSVTANNIVSEISPVDSSLQITGLRPNHGYIVRIIAVGSTGYTDASSPLALQTKPQSSNDFFNEPRQTTESANDVPTEVSVRPYQPVVEASGTTSSAVPMQREHSGSISQQQKRNVSGRRHTQGSHAAHEQPSEPFPNLPESEAAMKSLSDRLDQLRSETEQYKGQLPIEELKFQEDRDNLLKALQEAQQQVQDKSNATRKLNQHVATLVTEESAARKEKAIVDKQLDKALQERQRMDDDMTRWQAESAEIEERIQQLAMDQETYEKNARREVAELKAVFADEKAKNDMMEENIKTTIAKIKQLEDETKLLEDSNMDVGPSAHEEAAWERRLIEVQKRCNHLLIQQQHIKPALEHDQAVLEAWRVYYQQQVQACSVPQLEEPPVRRNSGHRTERATSISGLEISNVAGFSNSPSFATATPLFNINNGTIRFADRVGSPTTADTASHSPLASFVESNSETLPEATAEAGLAVDQAPTSPIVMGNFLPSDLLGDEAEGRFGAIGQRMRMDRDDSSSRNILPGLGAPETLEDYIQGPSSPISLQSRSPSIWASPRASNINLPGTSLFGDADRRSIRSNAGSARAASGGGSGTRFGSLFRPQRRDKVASDDGPTLGSLRSNESQSMPRPDGEDDIPEGSAAVLRRRGSHSGPSWMGQMLGRADNSASMDLPRKGKRFGLFGVKKSDPWGDVKDSSRPGSTTSVESHGLPRPSAESISRFGWSTSGDFSSSQLGNPISAANWRHGAQSSWGTNIHSRNMSLQHGNTFDGTFDQPNLFSGLAQAPIGTRPKSPPSSESRPQTSTTPARLNPAAQPFRGFFGSKDKKSKSNGQAGNRSSKDTYELLSDDGRNSPLDSRKSRDGNSILSMDYVSDNRDSLDQSMTSSAAPSESGATTKESFMRQLSRKSSAGLNSLVGRRGGGGKKASSAAVKDDTMEESQTTDDDMSKSSATFGEETPKDKAAMSPMLGSGGSVRGFSLRNLRRKKGERNGSLDGEDNDDADVKAQS